MGVSWEGYEFTECRDLGHAWSVKGVVAEAGPRIRYIRILHCLRCKTVRKDRITRGGDRTGSYGYPDSYHLEPVTPADRRRLRLHNVKTATKRGRLKAV